MYIITVWIESLWKDFWRLFHFSKYSICLLQLKNFKKLIKDLSKISWLKKKRSSNYQRSRLHLVSFLETIFHFYSSKKWKMVRLHVRQEFQEKKNPPKRPIKTGTNHLTKIFWKRRKLVFQFSSVFSLLFPKTGESSLFRI